MIGNGNLMVHGVTLGAKLVPMAEDGTPPAETKTVYIDESGVPHECMTLYLYDDAILYVMDQVATSNLATYNLTGSCAPVLSKVCLGDLSKGTGATYRECLESSVIATAMPDSEGKFSFSDVPGGEENLTVWITPPPEYAMTSFIDCQVESATGEPVTPPGGGDPVDPPEGGGSGGGSTEETGDLVYNKYVQREGQICMNCMGYGYINTVDDTCPICGGLGCTTYIESPNNGAYDVTIIGACPSDAVSIRISRFYGEGEPTLDDLLGTIAATITPSDSSYNIQVSWAEVGVEYIVWCLTETDDPITIDVIETIEAPCLSGDTLITMTDGTVKQMQDIVVGDMVISQTGKPTRVYNTARGVFNDYHVLYHFDDGTVIDETHDHRFYNVEQGFWQRLKHWKLGEHAVGQNGAEIALVSKELVTERAEMFGIFTEDGTYFANGLLSGAAQCNRTLLETATAEKAIDMMLSLEEEKIIKLMGLESVLP